MSDVVSDEEVQAALQDYLHVATVSDAIETAKLGIALDTETRSNLVALGVDPDEIEEEFGNG